MDNQIVEVMESLRQQGFCIVLKCLPKNKPWTIQGSVSEYDAPSPNQYIGKGLWCAESSFVRYESLSDYIIPQDALGKTPVEALTQLCEKVKYWQRKKQSEKDANYHEAQTQEKGRNPNAPG